MTSASVSVFIVSGSRFFDAVCQRAGLEHCFVCQIVHVIAHVFTVYKRGQLPVVERRIFADNIPEARLYHIHRSLTQNVHIPDDDRGHVRAEGGFHISRYHRRADRRIAVHRGRCGNNKIGQTLFKAHILAKVVDNARTDSDNQVGLFLKRRRSAQLSPARPG